MTAKHAMLRKSPHADVTAGAGEDAAMLELPSWAGDVWRLGRAGPWQVLLMSALIAINALTIGLYVHDKRAARRRGARRIPERTLHTLELAGGWPGALLAQRWLRHKTVKPGYQRIFRSIVGVHLLLTAALGAWWASTLWSG